jgi:hypothetical protein
MSAKKTSEPNSGTQGRNLGGAIHPTAHFSTTQPETQGRFREWSRRGRERHRWAKPRGRSKRERTRQGGNAATDSWHEIGRASDQPTGCKLPSA